MIRRMDDHLFLSDTVARQLLLHCPNKLHPCSDRGDWRSFSLLAQRKRTKRKGTHLFVALRVPRIYLN